MAEWMEGKDAPPTQSNDLRNSRDSSNDGRRNRKEKYDSKKSVNHNERVKPSRSG
jgi:hypothetical protein